MKHRWTEAEETYNYTILCHVMERPANHVTVGARELPNLSPHHTEWTLAEL